MRVVPRPEFYDAIEITNAITSDDLHAFYREVKPSGGATFTVMKMGQQILISTTDNPNWVGQFIPGDLVVFSDPIFVRLGPAEDYVPYDSVYVT